jgi:NNP family nitrate/nitrite transporter-like MFS transporter
MFVVGLLCAIVGVVYFFATQDTPDGNFRQLRVAGKLGKGLPPSMLLAVCRDPRVWALFVCYGCCFGIEITIENIIVLYLLDYFDYFRQLDHAQALRMAGLFAASFGLMNIFARSLGGWLGDQCGNRWGVSGRVKWLFVALFCEGLALLIFSRATDLAIAIPLLVLFGLFVKMSNGATYAVVPFVNRRATGAVSGIVGAGGSVGAMFAGFLLKGEGFNWHTALFILGAVITACSFLSLTVNVCDEDEPLPHVDAQHNFGAGVTTDPVGAVA